MNTELRKAIHGWNEIAPIAKYPKNKAEYNNLVNHLDTLLDITGADDNHELSGLINIISNLITEYEEKHIMASTSTGVDALRFLMQQHNLRQTDLNDIASQGVVSEILAGKRELTIRQIKLLAKRFNVSTATFI